MTKFIFIVFILVFSSFIFAQNEFKKSSPRIAQKGFYDHTGAGLNVFENYPVYNIPIKIVFNVLKDKIFPNEKIQIRVTIHNQDIKKPFRFYTSQNFFNQFFLVIRNEQGEALPRTVFFNRFLLDNDWQKEINGNDISSDALNTIDSIDSVKSKNRNSFRRLIELLPGENFSFMIPLNNFYEIESIGRYFVEGYYYPLGLITWQEKINKSSSVYSLGNYKLKIESFSFEILKHPFYQDTEKNFIPTKIQQADENFSSANPSIDIRKEDRFIMAARLYPTEVVKKHLKAIQTKKWTEYFETLHINKYLVSTYPNTDYYERYISSYPHEKKVIIKGFKNYLIQSLDYDLKEFEILKTVIKGNKAEVETKLDTVEPFQNLIFTKDEESGLHREQWISEEVKKLKRKMKVVYFLEQIEEVDPNYKYTENEVNPEKSPIFKVPHKLPIWKITGLDVQLLNEKNPLENLQVPLFGGEVDYYKETILFSLNSFEINPKYFPFLDKLSSFLIENPNLSIDIEGHTDDLGNNAYNQLLSKERATSVSDYLVEQGVDRNRISIAAKGETNPYINDRTEEGRSLNRRAHIIIQEKSIK